MTKVVNETGNRYGRLTIIKRAENDKHGSARWLCKCNCGNIITTNGKNLRRGDTKSCGCYNKEVVSKTWTGRKHTLKTKSKISDTKTGKYNINNRGNKHYNWNPNLTEEERVVGRNYLEYREWCKLIKERDEFTCQKCGKKGGYLNTHHIESYSDNPELRTELENGITLCETCHKNFHHQFGRGNNNRKQLIEFMEK